MHQGFRRTEERNQATKSKNKVMPTKYICDNADTCSHAYAFLIPSHKHLTRLSFPCVKISPNFLF